MGVSRGKAVASKADRHDRGEPGICGFLGESRIVLRRYLYQRALFECVSFEVFLFEVFIVKLFLYRLFLLRLFLVEMSLISGVIKTEFGVGTGGNGPASGRCWREGCRNGGIVV